ncbi:anti-phage dCTP deaminase [Paracoccus sediminilitoris]|uniref:anti-phage dCTP deaminase n=1 Tax=Paracoccus sediminilitoris TaxID=2202419 RepID=UPI00272DA84B|nr:anti-phage dCTP deaminase [Paracoccus sediminilitoris]
MPKSSTDSAHSEFPIVHSLGAEDLAFKPELVFGLVGPIGCNIDAAQDALSSHLARFGYTPVLLHLTKEVGKLFPKITDIADGKYESKIKTINRIVESSQQKDFLARVAILLISLRRSAINEKAGIRESQAPYIQSNGSAYIVRQLKRSQEIELLRKVYGEKFIQISISADEAEQFTAVQGIIGKEEPHLLQHEREHNARDLIHRDKDESQVTFGQRMLDTYHSGDLFIGGNTLSIHAQVGRFMDAFFGSNYVSPTKDEFGAYLAKVASLRTLDLSRQVGAAILSSDGDVITLGCNEVPKALGGNYWGEDDNPQRDIERKLESNKLETNRLIQDFVRTLSKHPKASFDAEEIINSQGFSKILKNSLISDLTEFGRMTHAEMTALMDAARLGRSVKGATIYVTTFPCHNCAKHIVASGIRRIVYVEPYAKSKAIELSGDALTTYKKSADRVVLEHFHGISPARYREIFAKPNKRRDENNNVKPWHFDTPKPMVNQFIGTHTMIEPNVLKDFSKTIDFVASKMVSGTPSPTD